MNILGIETSCDETAAAVVKDGCEVLSNVVYTQIPLHQPYGGVVPEIASRAHIEKISEVIRSALGDRWKVEGGRLNNGGITSFVPPPTSNLQPHLPIDAVAVTYGPGLAPALIVGLNAAKGLAKALNVPLIAINHMEAHLHTPFLYEVEGGRLKVEQRRDNSIVPPPTTVHQPPSTCTPALGLAISGGHTCWVDMPEYGRYELIGQTLDDAAGEAFDKAAKLLGLGYPGGPTIDKIAREYRLEVEGLQPPLIPFPKGRPREGVSALAGLKAEYCVSFSGLKTALLRYVQSQPSTNHRPPSTVHRPPSTNHLHLPLIVTSYQEAIVQAIADRTRAALKRRPYKSLIVGGGVSLNSRVREVLGEVAAQAKIPLLMAKPKFCGDNGAMIAGLAYYRRNITGDAAMHIDVAPSLEF